MFIDTCGHLSLKIGCIRMEPEGIVVLRGGPKGCGRRSGFDRRRSSRPGTGLSRLQSTTEAGL